MILHPLVVIDITRHNVLHLVGVDVHLQQAQLVRTDPDIAVSVAGHTVDVAVYTDIRQS